MSDLEEVKIDPRIEKRVWQGLGVKPLRQISEETGLDRDQIIRIREELLASVDDLTIAQKRQKLIIELEGIAQEARDAAAEADGRDKGSLYSSAVSAIKTVVGELARMEKNSTQAIDQLNALRVRELVNLIREAVDTSVPQIAKEYGLEEADLFEVFNKNLQEAAARRDSL